MNIAMIFMHSHDSLAHMDRHIKDQITENINRQYSLSVVIHKAKNIKSLGPFMFQVSVQTVAVM